MLLYRKFFFLLPLFLSRIISLWLIVGILLGFGGFSVLWCLLPLLHIILVTDWCWVTVISINVLLCCYWAVGPFFLSGFPFGSFFLSGFSFGSFFLSGFSFGPDFLIGRIFLLGFSLSFTGCILSGFSLSFTNLSVGILFSFFWSYLSVKNCIASGISSPQDGFPFRYFLPSFDVIRLSRTYFQALSLRRDSDWSSHPAFFIRFASSIIHVLDVLFWFASTTNTNRLTVITSLLIETPLIITYNFTLITNLLLVRYVYHKLHFCSVVVPYCTVRVVSLKLFEQRFYCKITLVYFDKI